jgi:glycosyltransferase involved in cell wall biosynthesis
VTAREHADAPKVSAVIITKNGEAVIGRCLASLAWADEIVVVDSGSTDRTLDICRDAGAKVFSADWEGFATQRNRGIDHASGDWVLALDMDEWVSEALQREIAEVTRSAQTAAVYRIPRLSSYCGRFMRHSGWWPDYVSRLFRRGAARFEGGLVHDRLVPGGPVGRLSNPLMHEPFTDLEQVLEKMNAYSMWGAQRMHAEGGRSGLARAVLHALWTFFRTYVLSRGFLDGREGFMLAVSNAEGTYYKYVKLMLLGRQKRDE